MYITQRRRYPAVRAPDGRRVRVYYQVLWPVRQPCHHGSQLASLGCRRRRYCLCGTGNLHNAGRASADRCIDLLLFPRPPRHAQLVNRFHLLGDGVLPRSALDLHLGDVGRARTVGCRRRGLCAMAARRYAMRRRCFGRAHRRGRLHQLASDAIRIYP